MTSTSTDGRARTGWGRATVAAAAWVGLWQVLAWTLHQPILLAGPWQVALRLVDLVPSLEFWATVATTVGRIGIGFTAAAVVGALLAVGSTRSRWLDAFIAVPVSTVRATPVVSFIILVLVWTSSSWLAAVVSFLMALPVMHTATAQGIVQRDVMLAEMSQVFQVPWWRRVVAVDLPQVMPFVVAGARTGVGLAWKAGVAAEVIGLPRGSIGERLYQAKLYLATADVLAWTVVVVAVSAAMEMVVLRLLRATEVAR
jgi:NitT/TauT family transport system permease protein